MDDRFTGVVMRSTGSWYDVRAEGGDASGGMTAGEMSKARIRGRFRLSGSRSTNPVVVGDRVVCSRGEGAARGGEVWIEQVLPRRNYIIRRSSNLSRESHIIASNMDRALVVATLFSPATSVEFIDRFLVTCEAYGVPAAIVLNKMDMVRAENGGREAAAHFTSIYERAGYRVIHASAVTGEGTDLLRELLGGHTTLISGNSGVGKSTLINAVEPGLDVRTGEISHAHHKGMHTTTFSQMYALTGGGAGGGAGGEKGGDAGGGENGGDAGGGAAGYIIDTPGIKGFGLIDIDAGELYHYFPEMMREASGCQYYNCTHTHEPGCAVIRAVEDGRIAEERYVSYLKMSEEDEKYRS